jgi:hypothetical protein
MRLRRRRGATLGFVAILALVLIIIGVGFFVITKMLGGGRELANSVDAGTLNVAKHAFLEPSKAARDFSNPDVASNFELLSPDGKFRLENYNRLVAQAMIVALNAKEEGTTTAASNAKKVWDALKDVSLFFRTSHGNPAVMGGHFQNLAAANNLKMMGQNGISLNGYDIAYTARGESTNVHVSPLLLSTFESSTLPISAGQRKSPTGNKFMAGYTPLSVALASGTLVFSGVPVGPQDRPHLISGFAFDTGKSPGFMPGYPAEILPPNSFRSAGETREEHTQTFGGAVASAIVGALDREYEAGIPNGYIEIKNGPKLESAGNMASTDKDIFSHALAGLGIDVSPGNKWFCRGSDNEVPTGDIKAYNTMINQIPDSNQIAKDLFLQNSIPTDQALKAAMEIIDVTNTWNSKNLINRWVDTNNMSATAKGWCYSHNVPDCTTSLKYIRKANGDPAQDCSEFRAITEYTDCECHWQQFGRNYRANDQSSRCVAMLPIFKKGYNEYGSEKGADAGTFYTNLENFKTRVMAARKDCSTCKTVHPSDQKSGMKSFKHGFHYAAPNTTYNFGAVVTPIDLLKHVDSAPKSEGCAQTTIVDFLHKRCRQIQPSITRDDVLRALSTKQLPLDATYYMYVKDGRLVMSDQKPVGAIAGTLPDGVGGTKPQMTCGTPYNVIGTLVNTSKDDVEALPNYSYDFFHNDKGRATRIARRNIKDSNINSFSDMPVISEMMRKVWVDPPGTTSTADIPPYKTDRDENTDGLFPGWAFRQAEAATCTDSANWIPSTGYNNLLGQLLFTNECEGGGQFCQPN